MAAKMPDDFQPNEEVAQILSSFRQATSENDKAKIRSLFNHIESAWKWHEANPSGYEN